MRMPSVYFVRQRQPAEAVIRRVSEEAGCERVQCYEFVALDRRLTAKEMAELRSISTRAEITPTRFWNEYNWGDPQLAKYTCTSK